MPPSAPTMGEALTKPCQPMTSAFWSSLPRSKAGQWNILPSRQLSDVGRQSIELCLPLGVEETNSKVVLCYCTTTFLGCICGGGLGKALTGTLFFLFPPPEAAASPCVMCGLALILGLEGNPQGHSARSNGWKELGKYSYHIYNLSLIHRCKVMGVVDECIMAINT